MINPVIHGTKTKIKDVFLEPCSCGTKKLPWMWNTGYWNIECINPKCYFIVSSVYKKCAIKQWNKHAIEGEQQ